MYHKLRNLIDIMQNREIMFIGDMVADVYLEGKIARISREAPVLILEHAGETVVPGGAANGVHNAATIGGNVYAVGVVGDDNAGSELIRVLKSKRVNTDGLIIDSSRSTITKTRVMAGGQATVRQQVVRIDKETSEPMAQHTKKAILEYIKEHLEQMQAVVLSDYGSGTISPDIISQVIDACHVAGIPCMVDSRYNIMSFKGVTVIKQNESEAAAAIGLKTLDENTLNIAGQTLQEKLEAQAVLITRGPDGMSLFERHGHTIHIPVTNKSEVYDVTGAGDTVVATMMLAIAAGASYHEAACLANFAAGVVVKKIGTSTVTPTELKNAIGDHYEICV